jgi:transcriptional regulator with XRE-family HTH domain
MKESQKRKTTLKALRERANLTQRQLSDLANVTERNLYAWESGESYPRLDRALAVARALDISLEDLCESLGLLPSRQDGSITEQGGDTD